MQIGVTFRKNLEIGPVFIINVVLGAIREFLKIFCSLWLMIVENFISLKWIQHFAKYIKAGARKILGNQNIGVSRGGKTTKIHALVNEHFQLIGVDLTGGNVHDNEVAIK